MKYVLEVGFKLRERVIRIHHDSPAIGAYTTEEINDKESKIFLSKSAVTVARNQRVGELRGSGWRQIQNVSLSFKTNTITFVCNSEETHLSIEEIVLSRRPLWRVQP